MPATPVLALPYPAASDAADVPHDIQALGVALDTIVAKELGYVEATATVSITSASPGAAHMLASLPAITFAARPIRLEFFTPYAQPASTANAQLLFGFFDGETQLGIAAQLLNPASSLYIVPIYAARRLTPSAGSHTYSARAWQASGNGSVQPGDGAGNNRQPMFIRATLA